MARRVAGCRRASLTYRELKGVSLSAALQQTTAVTCEAPTSRIAGWLPAGMLDWPGRLSATVFLSGCDFRCPFCHNPGLIGSTCGEAAWKPLAEHLTEKRGWLDGVVVTGGEPTTDPGLRDLLCALKVMGMPVKLDTNGNNPEAVRSIIEDDLVSMVALDIKTLPGRYDRLTGVHGSGDRVVQTAALLIDSGVSHEFRTTAYPGGLALDDFEAIASLLEGGDNYVIQQFRPEGTLDPRASAVLPYRADALLGVASLCCAYLPTTTRGV